MHESCLESFRHNEGLHAVCCSCGAMNDDGSDGIRQAEAINKKIFGLGAWAGTFFLAVASICEEHEYN